MAADSLSFQIRRIKTLQFAAFDELYRGHLEDIDLEHSAAFGTDDEYRMVGVRIKVTYLNQGNIFLTIETESFFVFDEDSWKLLSETGDIILPKPFALHLGSIAVGLTRGILHERTESGSLNDLVLPLIDLSGLVENDIVIPAGTNEYTDDNPAQ